MKKIRELLKPFLEIIFGAIVFFSYSLCLYGAGGTLALGIIATVIAAYFLTIGILKIVLGERFSKRTKRILLISGLSAFACFITAASIIAMVNGGLQVNGWIILIAMTVSSFAFGLFLILSEFANSKFISRLAQLFGAVFVLTLFLCVLIPPTSPVPAKIGDISILEVGLYVAYAIMAFEAMGELQVAGAPKEEKPVQE